MASRTVSVTEFKATCLALLDEIAGQGGAITITKRGRPLATARPARQARWKPAVSACSPRISTIE